ncbi:hypothetical protein BJP40_06400 [Streptomyces sp. CC53]|uniref:hypothetical protein n=1 Tax=Streptomyces sp. CC53 TaxID=1906740 RepID=UPI0008DD2D52|nr:hypothetical protein [Streptomyces sp. CC53]OII61153.1 hypothetical protein BJP40_06400 [Streptomyces sp. CC53]
MTDETTATQRRVRKPDPLSRYRKARAKADKARAAYEKVQVLAAALHDAEAEERAAYDALSDELGELGFVDGDE